AGATYAAASGTTVSNGQLTINTAGTTKDLTQSGGNLGGTGNLAVTGAFSWTNGQFSSPGPFTVSQTGGGSFAISGSSQAYLEGGSISTTSDVSITNPAFITTGNAHL